MKLEAIDPLNLSAICVATIRKVKALHFEVGVGKPANTFPELLAL